MKIQHKKSYILLLKSPWESEWWHTDKKLEDWDMNSPAGSLQKKKTADQQYAHKETKSRSEIHARC